MSEGYRILYVQSAKLSGATPRRVVIDNAACAITRACRKEPAVQRSYYELAEAYGFQIDTCPPRRH